MLSRRNISVVGVHMEEVAGQAKLGVRMMMRALKMHHKSQWSMIGLYLRGH